MRRWPAFSLVEMAVVLMITGMLLVQLPILMKIYKTHQTKQQIDLAIKSLGAYVAQHLPLPEPESPRADEEFILRGTLPYEKLGIKRKNPEIQYAVDRTLTDKKTHAENNGLCGIPACNHFINAVSPVRDMIAFELSADSIKMQVTRNNFMAQYCGTVCTLFANDACQAPTHMTPHSNVTTFTAKPLSPEEQAFFD